MLKISKQVKHFGELRCLATLPHSIIKTLPSLNQNSNPIAFFFPNRHRVLQLQITAQIANISLKCFHFTATSKQLL